MVVVVVVTATVATVATMAAMRAKIGKGKTKKNSNHSTRKKKTRKTSKLPPLCITYYMYICMLYGLQSVSAIIICTHKHMSLVDHIVVDNSVQQTQTHTLQSTYSYMYKHYQQHWTVSHKRKICANMCDSVHVRIWEMCLKRNIHCKLLQQ